MVLDFRFKVIGFSVWFSAFSFKFQVFRQKFQFFFFFYLLSSF